MDAHGAMRRPNEALACRDGHVTRVVQAIKMVAWGHSGSLAIL